MPDTVAGEVAAGRLHKTQDQITILSAIARSAKRSRRGE
jgi:hypothetical protein